LNELLGFLFHCFIVAGERSVQHAASTGPGQYQDAPVHVSVLQVHPYPDDPHVGPRALDVVGGVVAAGDGAAVGFDGRGRRLRGGVGLAGRARRVDVQAGHGRRPHVLREEKRSSL